MLDRPARFVERDFLLGDAAKHDGCAASHGRKDVDPIAVFELAGSLDEISVDRQTHALQESRKRGEAGCDGLAKLRLRYGLRSKLERGAVGPGELLGSGVIVDADLHTSSEPSRARKSGQPHASC
jgi:hypothetical protein